MGQPGRPPVTSISQWTEKFAAMAALLSTRFPLKAPELSYLAAVVQAERNYESGWWMAYDHQFRREALARRSLDWSVPDPRLYSEAFTGRARSIPRCAVCLLDYHLTQDCPQNPDRPWWGWPPSGSPWSGPPASSSPAGPRHPRRSLDVCRHYNEGRCRHAGISISALNAGRPPCHPGPPAGPVPTSPDGPPGAGKLSMATPLMPQTLYQFIIIFESVSIVKLLGVGCRWGRGGGVWGN